MFWTISGPGYGGRARHFSGDRQNREPVLAVKAPRKRRLEAPVNWSIGTLARLAGVNVETVRYYERIGLVTRPPRASKAIRRYSRDTLDRLRFIKRAQWLGFSLDEIAKLLSLGDADSCCETRVLGETKLDLLQRKLEELATIRSALERLLAECADHRGAGCPLVEALRGSGDLRKSPRPGFMSRAAARTRESRMPRSNAAI